MCSAFAREPIIVIIDPGHGGQAAVGSEAKKTLSSPNNAISPSGIREKDLTLELSIDIKRAFEEFNKAHTSTPIICILTREQDHNLDFGERTKVILASGNPAAVISIHFNGSKGGQALGTLTMIHNREHNARYAEDIQFGEGLSKAVAEPLAKYVPASKARAVISDSELHGGSGSYFFFQMNNHPELARIPKCFLEVEFIDRSDVENGLLKNKAKAFPEIAQAIVNYVSSQLVR
jgi:N-acetylmuramoyl-L-alanine amidase